ncbi:MAG: glycosyltransferase [Acidimicrobiales bacterium]|nr:glycosyltransferase [Acidimicrobiales bacterium]
MSPVRVGIDVTPLLGPPTGIHRVTRALIDALGAETDIEARGWLLTARGGRPDLAMPVRRSRIPASVAHRLWSSSALLGRAVTGRVDIVHGPNFVAPPTPRSVISLQDLTPVSHPEWCRPEVAAMAPAIRRAVSEGATVHVSSALVGAEAAALLGATDAQTRLVHHGVEPLVSADPATGRGIAGSPRYVLVLGTVERRKNAAAAAQAMAHLPDDVHLVIAGQEGNDEAALHGALEPIDPRRVRRLLIVDDHTRSALLRGATALLWPSIYEGFALPPLEALSVGTPVVATAVGALPELIGDLVPLVATGDDDAFVAATVDALENEADVSAAVTERIGALTWDRAASAMADIYREIASRGA